MHSSFKTCYAALPLLMAACLLASDADRDGNMGMEKIEPMLSISCQLVDAHPSGARVLVCTLKNTGDKPLKLFPFPGFLAEWRATSTLATRGTNTMSGKMRRVVQRGSYADGPSVDALLALEPGDMFVDTINFPGSLTNDTPFLRCKIAFESRVDDTRTGLWTGRVEMKGELVFRNSAVVDTVHADRAFDK